jgi:hypothetical protein
MTTIWTVLGIVIAANVLFIIWGVLRVRHRRLAAPPQERDSSGNVIALDAARTSEQETSRKVVNDEAGKSRTGTVGK